MKAYKTVNQKAISTDSVYYISGSTRYSITDYINSRWLDKVYPVGAVYLSVSGTNPATLFGGTWTRLSGGYIYCDTSTGQSSYSGRGTQSHTLTVSQMPSHNHTSTNGKHGAILNWDNNLSTGQYWGHQYQSGNFSSSAAYDIAYEYTSSTGSGSGHSHNIAYISMLCWRRTA